ncbi:hypothetical protein [Renibacterium salmoninarum]|uniref:hypothetical protein n=1 Tax=Renibacterium salmoninarum TaxID=1646 RepID=UPI0011AB699A|nr:hypothetical protein [Renibacterium salmoninarum]
MAGLPVVAALAARGRLFGWRKAAQPRQRIKLHAMTVPVVTVLRVQFLHSAKAYIAAVARTALSAAGIANAARK